MMPGGSKNVTGNSRLQHSNFTLKMSYLKQFVPAAIARRSICAQFPSSSANELIKQKCESCGH